MRITFLPWVVTRRIGGEDKPIARFAFESDARVYARNPKYKGLNVTFEGSESGVTTNSVVFYAKIVSRGEFYGFLAAQEFEFDPETNKFSGIIHDHARGRINLHRSYPKLPDSIYGNAVVWESGQP